MNKAKIKEMEWGVGKWVSQSVINGYNSPITLNLIKGLLEVAKKQETLEVWKVHKQQGVLSIHTGPWRQYAKTSSFVTWNTWNNHLK